MGRATGSGSLRYFAPRYGWAAKASERGDKDEIARLYARLRDEVESHLPEYPEIQGTLQRLAELSDKELEQADSLM